MKNIGLWYSFVLHICVIIPSLVTSVKPPNIILIVADDLGYNDVGFHGSEIYTPNLDELARSGVILENYYVQASCTPSRGQLLTGRYGIHIGLSIGNIRPLEPVCLPLDEVTIAEKLKERNYKTHMVGKWHLGHCRKECTPTYRGFDSFYGIHLGSGDHYRHRKKDRSGYNNPSGYDFWRNGNVSWNEGHYRSYSTTLYRNEALKIVSSHDQNHPLFMYLAFQAPHSPLQVPSKWLRRYYGIGNWKRRRHAGMVTALDSAVGDLVHSLKKHKLWENTVLVFTTDNGGQNIYGGNNWPLKGGKGSFWEGGVRGVGFVNSPLIKQPGRKSHHLMHVTDWFPTFLRISGTNLNQSKPLDGYDQWESISRNKVSPRKEVLLNIGSGNGRNPYAKWKQIPVCRAYVPKKRFYYRVFNSYKRKKTYFRRRRGCFKFWNGLWCERAAIRVGKWKLIIGPEKPGNWVAVPGSKHQTICSSRRENKKLLHLFNIKEDPWEKTEVSEKHPGVVKKLLKRLAKYKRSAVPPLKAKNYMRASPKWNGGVWGPWGCTVTA